MKFCSGLKFLGEREGKGVPARKGRSIAYHVKIFLNQGDEVLPNVVQSKQFLKRWCALRCEIWLRNLEKLPSGERAHGIDLSPKPQLRLYPGTG